MLLSKSAHIILVWAELCGENDTESMKCYREEQREGRKGKIKYV